MKFTIAAAAVAALSGVASADDVQSVPFQLQLVSDDSSLNGQVLTACHTGAGMESLCLNQGTGTNFNFNFTEGQPPVSQGFTATGNVVFDLVYTGGSVSQPMYFQLEPSTNVAMTLFGPSTDQGQPVAFDTTTNAMRVFTYMDDTARPAKAINAQALNRWFLCGTNFMGYQYKTLNWILGSGLPQNPSCKKVDVIRKF